MSIKTFRESINLVQNELQNVVIQNLTRPPFTPKVGQLFYGNLGEYDKKLFLWNGEWIDLTRRVHDGDKGDILVSNDVQLWEINPDVVTYEKLQKAVGNNVLLGNIAGANTDFAELTGTQVTAILDNFTDLLPGLVPESGGSATAVVTGDVAWKEIADILPDNVAYTDDPNDFSVEQSFLAGQDLNDTDIKGVRTLDFHPDHPITWNEKYHTINIPTGDGSVTKAGMDTLFDVHNATGGLLAQGTVVYPDGTSTAGYSNVQKCISNSHETISGPIGIIAYDILDGERGHVMIEGVLDPIDASTFALGAVYLSPTNAGELTSIKPEFPNYDVALGNVDSNVAAGVITIDTRFNLQNTLTNFWNGTIRESFVFEITSDGGTITGSLYPKGAQPNLTLLLSDGFHTYVPASISLIAGTSTNPQHNFIYITKVSKALEVSTSSFPLEEHIKVGVALVQTPADVLADGPLKNQNFNDHIQDDDGQGHLGHVTARLRLEGAKWISGAKLSAIAADSVSTVSTLGGVVSQLHRQTWEPTDMALGDHVHVVNDFITPYIPVTNLDSIVQNAVGDTLANSSFSLVFWGSINSGLAADKLMVNLPVGFYAENNPEGAVSDAFNYSIYAIPAEFTGTGFLIARVTYVQEANGDWSVYQVEDLTDRTAVGGGGAGGGTGVTTFAGLTDTPNTYVGSEDYEVVVGPGGLGLEFREPTIHTYIHDQIAPAIVWTINHPMKKLYPSVTVISSAGTTVEGEIEYISISQLTITFNAAFSGEASIN
jgi:hypothetical protein